MDPAAALHPLLFDAGAGFVARRLSLADAPRLQAFIEANPEYWWRIGDAPPPPDEAEQELRSRPPPELGGREHIDLGFWRETGPSSPELIGSAIVDTDLVLEGCWHIALFLVATPLHGQGVAARLFRALEAWARAGGAQWLRLCVVQGNLPAERFWERQGFVPLRSREGVPAGKRVNTVRVLLKPLTAAPPEDYLARVPRDRPELAA